MKNLLRFLILLVLSLALVLVSLVVAAAITNYTPEAVESVYSGDQPEVLPDTLKIDVMNWNIGYCGLNEEMDFFYDGGEHVRPDKASVIRNLEEIRSFIRKNDSVDFILLQEVDRRSKRGYLIAQTDSIKSDFPYWHAAFVKNYDVFFVPLPPLKPMGRVESGLLSLSRYEPLSSTRHAFPGNYSFPMGLFMLDRCFLVNRYPLDNGKELLIVNTHNSAYDDGTLKKEQMEYLKGFLLEEHSKGNHIIVGGDWNQTPNDFVPEFESNIFDTLSLTYLPGDYLPADWTWAYDGSIPTNRRVRTPYDPETSRTTVIDYYLLSPGIELLKVETINLDFKYSDHQPVLLKCKIEPACRQTGIEDERWKMKNGKFLSCPLLTHTLNFTFCILHFTLICNR